MAGEIPVIQTVELKPVSAENYGIQSGEVRLFPLNLWQGLTHDQVASLIKLIPTFSQNPSLRQVAKELLMASFKMPVASGSKENLLALRVEKLQKMGEISCAYKLGKAHPEVLGRAWSMLQFDYYIAVENYTEALKLTKENLVRNPESKAWLKSMIILQLLKGENEAALLSLDLFSEKYADKEEDFISLARSISQKKSLPADFKPTDIATFKLWIKENPENIKRTPGHFLSLVFYAAALKSLTSGDVVLFAEQAFEQGRLSEKKLLDLYKQYGAEERKEVKEGALKLPVALSIDVWLKDSPITRARLYEKILGEKDLVQKALLIETFVKNVRTAGYHRLQGVLVPMLKVLPVETKFAAHAELFTEILLIHEEETIATKWLSLLPMDKKKQITPKIISHMPLLGLDPKQKLFDLWFIDFEKTVKDPQTPVSVLGIFESMVPGVTQQRLLRFNLPHDQGSANASALLWQAAFALQKQKGVAVVRALQLADQALQENNALLMPYVIHALKTLNLESTARDLSVKALGMAHKKSPAHEERGSSE